MARHLAADDVIRRAVTAIPFAIATLALLAIACSSGDDDGPESTTTPARRAIAAAPTASPTPAAQDGLDRDIVIEVRGPFAWPAVGPITSFMGPEHPEGIDIGLDAPGAASNPEVRATADGVVAFAGGSDDETLGISIVIEHGNGITTTYGHLDELSVEEGDEVAQGQTIGIGGSTGVSTGRHLHFEVRQDGATVDPLDVLPTGDAGGGSEAAARQTLDCGRTPLALPVGSQAVLNLGGLLRDGERVVGAEAEPLNDGPALEQRVEGVSRVRLTSALSFEGPSSRQDEYSLRVTVDSASGNRAVTCDVNVQRRSVATVFYARAIPETEAEAEPEPTVEPTPTATPILQVQVPSYEVPASSGGGSESPTYGVPAGATPAISSPSYGVPGSQ
jgi:hypothetical protein